MGEVIEHKVLIAPLFPRVDAEMRSGHDESACIRTIDSTDEKGMSLKDIEIRGAREHNLRSVDLTIPHNKLVVMTGVSGSGKSSLAFDTLYAEGQRRYVESLSSYARPVSYTHLTLPTICSV